MMIILIITIALKRKEFLHGAIEYFMKRMRNVKEKSTCTNIQGKNLCFLITDQFMLSLTYKYVRSIKHKK